MIGHIVRRRAAVRRCVALLGIVGAAHAMPAQVTSPGAAIVGRWRGASTCMVSDTDSKCHNGQLTIDVSPASDARAARWTAIIALDGTREPTGAVDFTFDPKTQQWTGEYNAPNGRVRWSLSVAQGKVLYGYLLQLPTLHVLRRVNLSRSPGPG